MRRASSLTRTSRCTFSRGRQPGQHPLHQAEPVSGKQRDCSNDAPMPRRRRSLPLHSLTVEGLSDNIDDYPGRCSAQVDDCSAVPCPFVHLTPLQSALAKLLDEDGEKFFVGP